jgi:hypothetical protein
MIPWHIRFVKGKGKVNRKIGNRKALPPRSDAKDLWMDPLSFSLGWDI